MNKVLRVPFEELKISKEEALRYSGVRGDADEKTLELLSEALDLLKEDLEPKAVFCEVSVGYTPDGLYLGDDFIKSEGLRKFLKGAEGAYLLAATAGIEADRLIARFSAVRPSLALMIDSAAAAVVEALCNKLCGEYFNVRECERFSPGYGDFPMDYQKDIIKILCAEINIGVNLTESMMLTPSKSVTAIVPKR